MKVQYYNKKVSAFGGISLINHNFNKTGMSALIDKELGLRVKTVGFQYSEIIRNMSNGYMSGGDVIEDIKTHIGGDLKMIPNNNVPSPDTVLRGLKELSTPNTIYRSESGKEYAFNINVKLNHLNIKSLLLTKQLEAGKSYDFDYDNQINANNKWDSKKTYKKNKGYFPGIATIGNMIVGVENRDGSANVKFKQEETLNRMYSDLKTHDITINRSRMDAGSYSKNILDVVSNHSNLFYIRSNKSMAVLDKVRNIKDWKEVTINHRKYEVASIKFTQFFEDREYRLVVMREQDKTNQQLNAFTKDTLKYRTILTNDWQSTERAVIEYYNARGGSEKIFDQMNNDFGWKHLPFSFLNENNVFMIITAMIKNFYNYIVEKVSQHFDGITPTSRLKRFVFRFITVAGNWVYQGRQWVLKLYTNKPYHKLI